MTSNQVHWVCLECGDKYRTNKPDPRKYHTYHYNTCDICGEEKVAVTAARNYGIRMEKGSNSTGLERSKEDG